MPEANQAQTKRRFPLIWVKSTQSPRVGVAEQHPDHPGGEVFIADDQPAQVAKTDLVTQKLRSGELVEITEEEAAGDATA